MEYIRRCMLVVLTATLAACSTIQAPEVNSSVELEISKEVPKAVTLELRNTKVESKDYPTLDTALAQAISDRFKCSFQIALDAIQFATKYAHKEFPQRDHLLAFIAIESGFDPKASFKGSYGVMQVLVKTHRDKIQGRFDLQEQIRVGSYIAHEAYQEVGSKDAAIMAYNVGTGAYKKGKRPRRYLQEYHSLLAWFKNQDKGYKLV